jgi:hypothetical protein
MTTSTSALDAAVLRAGWEPAKIRAEIATLDTRPGFEGLPEEILAACRASAEADAARIEAEGVAAEAELAARAARGRRTLDLPYIR